MMRFEAALECETQKLLWMHYVQHAKHTFDSALFTNNLCFSSAYLSLDVRLAGRRQHASARVPNPPRYGHVYADIFVYWLAN